MSGGDTIATERGEQALLAADVAPPPGLTGVAETLAAEILFGLPSRADVAAAVRDAATALDLTGLEASLLLQRLVVRDSLFLRVEPAVAIDAQLRSLLLFAPLSHASLWLGDGSGSPVCVASAGVTQPRRPIRTASTQALQGASSPNGSGRWGGSDGVRTMMVRTEEHRAVLVVRTRRGKTRAGLAHAAETAAALRPVLDRRRLLDHMSQSTAQVLAAVDRRLTRFGLDIHDGPLQRMSLLAGELVLLNRQLAELVTDEESRTVAERRVTELAEAASDATHELRELARSAGGRPTDPLVVRLGRDVLEFERQTGIAVNLVIEGDVDRTTDSQRIAVARVVEEALANIREHSRATVVQVTLRRDPDALHLTVEDDGRGFDVARARSRAERQGRLGLASMRERVRMLGGRLEVTSGRGEPTVVTAVLPAWEVSEPSLSAALASRVRKAR